ncbi:2,3-bisphosphoglycerate-independent phosphoglycerate mutase [Candidatus Babeliales bacterium]|nr:2,3-bisphosphoglycerate-independent phosphoglycerate mutase [Candidatus Babeliales bacterium]MBP9844076.1 2,3-bisphosphoglycerate-independent phosphoglycerate mutase [Candidatus Babeliales bacterium]
MPKKSPTLLVILDGLGISDEKKYNALYQAQTPHLDYWQRQHFYTTLQAAGIFVGLEQDYNGNSEVGHFTIGAGKIIQQSSTLLNKNLHADKLYTNTTLANLLQNFNPTTKIHLLGMASDGNIHSNLDHARAFISTLGKTTKAPILVHAFLDGRDTPPESALTYLNILQADFEKHSCGKIASIHGRYYAMDRNNNWDRTQKSFDILTKQQSKHTPYEQAITENYHHKIFDEFIEPVACVQDHTIQPGDGVIFFNFRPDRAIQLTKLLLELDLAFLVTPILYHESLPTTPLLEAVQTNQTLLEILSSHNKKIMTIAETEKYAHVSYFFNGHRDINFATETRILIPSSPQEPVDDPKMQAEKITATIIDSLKNDPKDFYLANYANADMVGHSGNLKATISAIECLDEQLGKLYQEVVLNQNGTMYITADHGNAEMMFNEHGNQPCTSHTSNPVPFYMLCQDTKKKLNHFMNIHHKNGLADIAPLILKNMKLV